MLRKRHAYPGAVLQRTQGVFLNSLMQLQLLLACAELHCVLPIAQHRSAGRVRFETRNKREPCLIYSKL